MSDPNVWKPGEPVTFKIDDSSLLSAHEKGDGALAVGRDHEKRLQEQKTTLEHHTGLLEALERDKTDERDFDKQVGRINEHDARLGNCASRDELAKLRDELREEIRQAAGLSNLLTK